MGSGTFMLTHQEGEQYNLKTACKSVKQISIAWISQIIEPQSITNTNASGLQGVAAKEYNGTYLEPGNCKRS